MEKQTIIWTALPNGSDGGNAAGSTLRLSVIASPRLWNDEASVTKMQLASFPDFLDWPLLMQSATFDVSFNGAAPLPATIVTKQPLRSDLWKGLFKNDTLVIPFKFQNLTDLGILSFSAGVIHDTIREVFQNAATDPAYNAGTDLVPRDVLADDPTLGEIAIPTEPPKDYVPIPKDDAPHFIGSPEPEKEPPAPIEPKPDGCSGWAGCGGCLTLPIQLLRRFLKWIGMLATLPFTMGMGGGGGFTPLSAPASRKQAFDDLRNFVKPTSKISADLPTPAALEETYDFHQMIATLGDYPNLLRYLGLVVDLEVTLAAPLPANGTVTITPHVTLATATTPYTPRTHYAIDADHFLARPGAASDLRNGLLRVDDKDRFRVLQLDVAGGGTKLQSTATTLVDHRKYDRWPPNAPKKEGLPSLQTAGLSIARAEQAAHLKERFANAWALNVALAAIDHSEPPDSAAPEAKDDLFAEDLVRGYRVDVFDDQSNAWHSLMQRVGTYRFDETQPAAVTLDHEEDEGFVQMSVTEPVPGAGPRVLRAHESLFTWNGWSLGAPRYGNTILKSSEHTPELTEVGPPSNAPATQFKMEATFEPKAKSLPRLRFGYTYKLRVRAVDLAGNSVFSPADPAFAETQLEVTEETTYRRFEPVSPPMVMLQAKPVEGESLERLVVRSRFDDAVADIESQQTARHLVPPKTSQLMAEYHRKFDGAPAMASDLTAYQLAAREAGSLTHLVDPVTGVRTKIFGVTDEFAPYSVQTEDTFELAYLPDPFSRGVLLLGLPGMPAPDDVVDLVNKIPFTGTEWWNPKPFRLRVTGIKAGAAAALPAWDEPSAVLDVQVPQGETFEVKISSYFNAADLERMAVWKWTAERGAPNLDELRDSVIAGRNWLHHPFRTLVLVHAVQQPLRIPSFDSIAAAKLPTATIATISGDFRVDAKSSGKVDVNAKWRDPFDDLRKPAFDATTDFLDYKMKLPEVRIEPPADVFGFAIDHAVGDTKYHAVTYEPVASTRFREYFPPTISDDPQNLVRPTSAEATVPETIDILNSARPDAPKPLYIVPLFHWSRSGPPLKPRAKRSCAGLRVYMNRPWYSSGAGELLGVLLQPASVAFNTPDSDKLKKYTSQWGMDPLWASSKTHPLAKANFHSAAVPPMTVRLEELPLDVDVVGYAPQYDSTRNLWFCDIQLDPGLAYFPMVRFALARFQPKSVAPMHISHVVPADFIQLVPHREVSYDLTNLDATGVIEVEAKGPVYIHDTQSGFDSTKFLVRLEQRSPLGGSDEIGWEPLSSHLMRHVVRDKEHSVWSVQITVATPRPNPMRIVVIEVEGFARDSGTIHDPLELLEGAGLPFGDDQGELPLPFGVGYRITFADALEVP